MPRTSLIREDAEGLNVRTDGSVFRPGAVRGHAHAIRMDDGGLKAGDRVPARHVGGTPIARITLPDGTVTSWAEEYTARKDATVAPVDARWLADGRRDLTTITTEKAARTQPRTVPVLTGDELMERLRSR